jgi:hypothetical protein
LHRDLRLDETRRWLHSPPSATSAHGFRSQEYLHEFAPDQIRELAFCGNNRAHFSNLRGNIVTGRINFDSLKKIDNEAVVALLLELQGLGNGRIRLVQRIEAT